MAENYKSSEPEDVTELKTFQNEQELCNKQAVQKKQENPQEENDDYGLESIKDNTLELQPACYPILPKTKSNLREKSHVEFRVTPRDKDGKGVSKHSSLEVLNEGITSKQLTCSPQHQRKARQSFSGPSSKKVRVQRFSVGANNQPKLSARDNISQPLPLVPENGIPESVQKPPEKKIFVELDELDMPKRTWRETTRWIKYEEHVQASGTWSRPQIPFVDFEGFLALKDYLHEGLLFLEFMPDGLLDFSHTLATTITMCNRIEPRYRLKLQQIIYLPVMHQGDTHKRLILKKLHRETVEKDEADRRTEAIKRAFEPSSDRIRNLWVNLLTKALMYSKLSAGYSDNDDDDDMDFDEALINIPIGKSQSKEVMDSWKHVQLMSSIPEHNCSVTISQYSDIKHDHYPLSTNQVHILKALSSDCQGVAIKFASLDFLNEFESFAVLVRMTNAVNLCDFLEVPIDCKFVFLLCSSSRGNRQKDLNVCRAFGSLITDKVFLHDLLLARSKHDVIVGVDKYVKDSVLFPPGQWDLDYLKPATEEITQLSAQRHKIRSLTIMKSPPRRRKNSYFVNNVSVNEVAENNMSTKPSSLALPIRRDTTTTADDVLSFLREYHKAPDNTSLVYSPLLAMYPLERDGRWFGGLRREMARRYPLYWSDIKDAFHIQCLAAIFFVTFGVIALSVTFGKLLLIYTDGYMGDSEMLLATSCSCMLMALVGTEPHAVISGTAAMVIIETVIFKAAALVDIHYLTWRLWIGLWIAIIILLILAFEKTYWITYCTRFTEEILHSMVAILFIAEAFKDIYKTFQKHPLHDSYISCINIDQNGTSSTNNNGCPYPEAIGRPNTALLHTIILFSTFGIAIGLRLFQNTRYFSPPVRRLLNFFSIPLAVNIMFVVSKFVNVYVNTVQIKHGIKLSSPDKRAWLVNPSLSGKGSLGWGMSVLAIFPAVFVLIVIFIESEITALMCSKETISKKGTGFHGNLLVVAISVIVCSLLGLPWMCLAAVETNNHIDSLRVWTSYNIPGIKSHVEKIRQQRVSLFCIGLATGMFLYLPFSYGQIPIAVLSGLTLYMGVVATFGVQFFKRVELIFMAPSQQPYIEYISNVPLRKVHLFTAIQIVMIALLMVIKSVESISFIFPIFIMLMIPTRVLLGKYVFSQEEMQQLDNEAEEHDN